VCIWLTEGDGSNRLTRLGVALASRIPLASRALKAVRPTIVIDTFRRVRCKHYIVIRIPMPPVRYDRRTLATPFLF